MKTKKSYTCILFFVLISLFNIDLFSQSSTKGTLEGRITSIQNGEVLPFANILVNGTNNGTAADLDGKYIIRKINSGSREITISYVGYQTKTVSVVIEPDKITELNVALDISAVKGRQVVISAQRIGQQAAINDQINSNTIKNVVAADRLQENPDANAAEAIGRLPGVSLIRSGGEGTEVVIRGLDPSYSQIMLDGVPLPTDDISGISQYDLQSVEVFKSITPDMQGDAVAGAVNLKLNEALSGFKLSLMALGGYNNLNDYWKNYKYVANVSDRFLDNNLGILLNLDAESTNRSDQTLSASYETKTVPPLGQLAPLFVDGINLNDIYRINYKDAATLVLDYEPSTVTKILFENFFSHTDQDYNDVTKSYGANNGTVNYSMDFTPNVKSELYVGNLKVVQQFEPFELDEGVSFSVSHSYTPISRDWSFSYNGIGLKNYGTQAVQSLPLNQILNSATDTLSTETLDNFYLGTMGWTSSQSIEKNIDAYINSKIPFEFGESTHGYIKLGGEYKATNHDQDYYTATNPVGGLTVWGDYAIKNFPWAKEFGHASLTMQGINNGIVNNFLKGQYNFGWYPNFDRLNKIFDWWNNFSNYYIYQNPAATPAPFINGYIGFIPDWVSITQNLQRVNQFYYAGYFMGEIDMGDIISFIPGFRYEKVQDDLGGWFILPTTASSQASQRIKPGYSTYAVQNNNYLLPMIHLKIKPLSWFQSLLSFTQSLHRPDFGQLVPYIYVNTSTAGGPQSFTAGNPTLRPELWTNYDLQLAAFGDKIGLISVSGFYKKVQDAIWTPSIYRVSGQPWLYINEGFNIGQYFGGNSSNSTVLITIPQNHTFPIYLKGLEFEAQTNLWYLPSPLNHISLDLNFTLISSETKYEYSKTLNENEGFDNKGRPIIKLVSVDSIYSGPMLNQPKSIVNFSFGYNFKGFNLWLSYQYTGSMVTSFPNQEEFQESVSKFVLWDLQISQQLPVNGLEAIVNWANINNPIAYHNFLADPRPTYLESYGWTLDFGLRYKL
jgi:TonB-dependent receptor